MGLCNRRQFLLTICSLQLIATVERQVFDFLGYMWLPILVNFFDIIFVILGFFGAYQYRPKYIITYCVWNFLWLGWNIFLTCFYLNIGILDKNSDLLNFGTGSYSWWLTNGPSCIATFNITEPELGRPARPSNVFNCIVDYEIIEISHAAIQCIFAVVAIISGICLIRLFGEEDDSFDFVGGGDFGLAGHTPLHPMYVSYSALPPPAYAGKNLADNYPTGTTSSHHSTYRETIVPDKSSFIGTGLSKVHPGTDSISIREPADSCDDYSNPLDHLQRPMSQNDEYDSLSSAARMKYQKNKIQHPYTSRYSPVPRSRLNRTANRQSRDSFRPRVFTDHIRDRPMRSFYSDPRLAGEENVTDAHNETDRSHRDSRPLSMYANNF